MSGSLDTQLVGFGSAEQWQRALPNAPRVPQRGAPIEPHRPAGIGLGQQTQPARGQVGAAGEFLDGCEGRGPCRDDLRRPSFAKPVDLPQPEPQGEAGIGARLKAVVPPTRIHIDLAHLYPMLLRIADELRGSIKAHGLRIEQPAGEHRGLIIFDP